MNKTLKERLESLLGQGSDHDSKYYKEHIEELERTITDLRAKIDKLNEENKGLYGNISVEFQHKIDKYQI